MSKLSVIDQISFSGLNFIHGNTLYNDLIKFRGPGGGFNLDFPIWVEEKLGRGGEPMSARHSNATPLTIHI